MEDKTIEMLIKNIDQKIMELRFCLAGTSSKELQEKIISRLMSLDVEKNLYLEQLKRRG